MSRPKTSDVPVFTRYCCGNPMALKTKYVDGNELVNCRHCDRREEIGSDGMSIHPPREAVKAATAATLMTEILAGLPANL